MLLRILHGVSTSHQADAAPAGLANSDGQTLDLLHTGQHAVVRNISCSNKDLRNKLLTMGLTEGTQVEVTAIAPLGDPMSIRLLGCKLSLRLSEARSILVNPLS